MLYRNDIRFEQFLSLFNYRAEPIFNREMPTWRDDYDTIIAQWSSAELTDAGRVAWKEFNKRYNGLQVEDGVFIADCM